MAQTTTVIVGVALIAWRLAQKLEFATVRLEVRAKKARAAIGVLLAAGGNTDTSAGGRRARTEAGLISGTIGIGFALVQARVTGSTAIALVVGADAERFGVTITVLQTLIGQLRLGQFVVAGVRAGQTTRGHGPVGDAIDGLYGLADTGAGVSAVLARKSSAAGVRVLTAAAAN